MKWIALACMLIASPAFAKNDGRWDNSPYRDWFARQHNQLNNYCCDGADAYFYEGKYQINADGSVLITRDDKSETTIGKELIVKYDAENPDPNPTGHAIWWISDYGYTYCFAYGPQT